MAPQESNQSLKCSRPRPKQVNRFCHFWLLNALFCGKTKITSTTLAAAANRRPSGLPRLNNIVAKGLAVGAEEAVSWGHRLLHQARPHACSEGSELSQRKRPKHPLVGVATIPGQCGRWAGSCRMTMVASACQRRKEIEWQTVKAKQRQVRMKNVTAISLASKAKAAPAIKLAVLMAFR